MWVAPPSHVTDDPDLVYNSRKRGGDSADRYFKATEMIAGVKDMRFQALMPDVLHWLGVKKIDNMISMVCAITIKHRPVLTFSRT